MGRAVSTATKGRMIRLFTALSVPDEVADAIRTLLRWAGEFGAQAASRVKAVAAVCSPLDLAAASTCLDRGFGRHVYTPRSVG